MSTTSNKIVFFGSGPVAAASLRSLAQHFQIEAVVTKPVTQHEMQASAPKAPLKLVDNKTALTELIQAEQFTSRLGVIVDFGIIVEQSVIDAFPLGIVNSHFSLLPEWRGADPITFSILSGQKQTGVSLMTIVSGLDEGPLLDTQTLDIAPGTTTPELTDQLVALSNTMLANTLPKYINGTIKPLPQPDRPATYSRKLTKEDGVLDWNKPAAALECEIRAFITWPKSRTSLGGKDVVVTKAHVVDAAGEPGTITVEGKQIIVTTTEGGLSLDTLKPAGKGEMSAEAFLNGYKL